MAAYPNVQLHIDGRWRPAEGNRTLPVLNPATEEEIGTVAHASRADLDEALAAAERDSSSGGRSPPSTAPS